jgi:hypothetical protein
MDVLLWLDLRTENPKDRAKTLFFDSRSHQDWLFYRHTTEDNQIESR